MSKKVTIYCKTNRKIYNSITEAAQEAGIEGWKLSQALQRKSVASYNGLTFSKRKFRGLPINNLENWRSARCKALVCETTGQRFESQKALSMQLGLNQMVISKAFKHNGKFVDNNGNVYLRNNPVHSLVATTFVSNKSNEKVDSEQTTLQNTLVSFIKKGMYSEAAVLCDSMQKIYMKK